MRGSTSANAFSDASVQAAVLEEWKKRSAKHKEAAISLREKVRQLKSDAEAGRRAAQWMQERDALNCEQEACEAALGAIEKSLGDVVSDADGERHQLELSALKVLLSQQLTEVGALWHTSNARQLQTSSSGAASVDRVVDIREWIAEELRKCEANIEALATPSAGFEHQQKAVVECRAAARQAQLTFAALCDSYHPAHQLRVTFEAALKSAEEDTLARIEGARAPRAAATPPDILRTVGLIVRMGQSARQFDISAATMTALAERVSAVYPGMPSAQVHVAVEESIALRKARALSQAAVSDFQRTNIFLLSSCESAFLVAQQSEKQRQEKAEAARQRVEAQNRRHAHLTEERAAYEAVLRQRQSVKERMQAAAVAKEKALQAKRAIEFQERLRLFEAYEVQQSALRQKERELAELQAQAMEEEKAARMRRNEERVEYRRQRDEQRQSEKKKREQELLALRAKKQDALQRFFASVDKQIGVEADPQRFLKATSSSAQTERYTTLAQTVMPSITGYSDEQIMKDPRVRLYHALLAAGLHTTPYGREVATRGYRVSAAQQSSEGNPLRREFS
ncbi:hypothetical protein, conserved [Leishmania donovani]|uniref:Uncharacterized protein n=1 Tax=Leishmania donovani TaxID=5661 RepID=E9BAH5_LEIDO|nr:hypothetical protein, conserved [Leishmania donovani]CBZ32248.1 hypothetical protein, conserved [Leishmania donovani]